MTQRVSTIPPRSAVPENDKWDLASIFASEADWEAEISKLDAEFPALLSFRGRLGESAAVVVECFEAAEGIMRRLGRVFSYGRLGLEAETTDERAAARADRARALYSRGAATLSFRDPELVSVGFETLRRWVQEEPRLTVYSQYFDALERQQTHVRSAEVEELLSQLADPFNTVSLIPVALSDADLQFRPAHGSESDEPLELVQGSYKVLNIHPDRTVRRTAWESYADGYLSLRHGLANTLSAGVRQHVFTARARRYGSSLESSLGAKHVPVDVFHRLIEAYRQNLPTWHRYWRLRRKALGYNALHVFDTRAPLTPESTEIHFPKAVEWIAAGMQPLGDEYVSILRRGALEERWIDVYPSLGKRSGAFSGGSPGTHPFILISYSGDVGSLSTLAHELGHSMHHWYAWRAQPLVYARAGSFLGEVASNFNQAMVRAHLLATRPERDFQIALLEEAMGNFHRYFFIMPTLARFELEIHERVERGQALTARGLSTLMADLFREGYGDDVVMDEERVGITWAQFPVHMYLNFYVYEYATGISAAHALAERVLGGEPRAAEDYLDFLRSGSSHYPLDTLRRAGVDMAGPEAVERTFSVMAGYVERLEQLLGVQG